MRETKQTKRGNPDPAMIAEAEQYIDAVLSAGLDTLKVMRDNNEVDKRMLYYFGMSNNDELKTRRKATIEKKYASVDNELFAKMSDYKAMANYKGDTHDDQYEVCYQKGNYMVIGISKPLMNGREKPARNYQIGFNRLEAPEFWGFCEKLPQRY